MNLKAFGKALLFPPLGVLLILTPLSAAYLIYSLLCWDVKSVQAVLSYVLATYVLTVWCMKLPRLIQRFLTFKEENRYARRWQDDVHLRIRLSLYSSLVWNTVYAVFQLVLGYYHHTFWYYSLAGYYMSLAVMRFVLAGHARRHGAGEELKKELVRYRACGIVFLMMNLALSLIIFFMVYWNRTFHHNEITTIAMAAYTFGAMAIAIVNLIKYRRYNSPLYSASKAINLAAACVSMLTLESTMLTTFNDGSLTPEAVRLFLALSGIAVSAVIITMAVMMIVRGTKQIRQLSEDKGEAYE